MASKCPLCGVCGSVSSAVYCFECEKNLCTECETRHKSFNATVSHPTIAIEKYDHIPIDALKTSQIYPEHSDRFVAYCEFHECACCLKCTFKEHKQCKDLLTINEVAGGVKFSNALNECEMSLKENKENIQAIIKDREQNLSSLKAEKDKIKTEIKETRRKVDEHLDKLETKLIQELDTLEELHTASIRTFITSLEKKEQEIEETRCNLSSLKDHGSDLQIFLLMKRTEKLSSTADEFLKSLSLGEDLKSISPYVEIDKTLQTLEKIVPTFGRVTMNSSSCGFLLRSRKDKHAQLQISSERTIESTELELIKHVDVNKNWLYGCCFLSDGRFAITSNYEPCLVMMKEGDKVHTLVKIKQFNVFDITHIPSTNVLAATSGGGVKQYINLIDVNTRNITRSFPSDTYNYGITCKDGYLIYSAKDLGICEMNIENGKITTIKNIFNMSGNSYVAAYRDKIYFTNKDAQTVACCSMNGAMKWEIRVSKLLRHPRGICVDKHAYVYVIGEESSNLVVISPAGDRHFELLNEKDGLKQPQAVDYDEIHNRILVSNRDKKVFLYYVN